MHHPKVSVILPVYNGEKYLGEAIESILNQTYSNFELIIINDGSKDNSENIIKEFCDKRIRYYKQINQGLAKALNNAIQESRGEYIARQDQDDISFENRFEKQVAFLETHPEYGMVGSWAEILDESINSKQYHKHPSQSIILKFYLLFSNPFVHSSMMIRKSVFEKIGLYSTDKTRQPPEDYELWSRISRSYDIANIPEVLQIYRSGAGRMSTNGKNPFTENMIKICRENFGMALSEDLSNNLVIDIAELTNGCYNRICPKSNFLAISKCLYKIKDSYEVPSLSKNKLNYHINLLLLSILPNYIKYKYGKIYSIVPSIVIRVFRKFLSICSWILKVS